MKRPLILYLNLGTPASPSVRDVRAYLRAFLMDPYVLNIPAPLRWFLVNGFIVPTRAQRSARAYSAIWTTQGSPLLVHSHNFVAKLKKELEGEADVELVMRYGEPSIRNVLQKALARGEPSRLVIFPAYPQYALSSTETGIQEIKRVARSLGYKGRIESITSYYDWPRFIEAVARRIEATVQKKNCDFLLFSFHGLPKSHIRKLNSECRFGECCFQKQDHVLTQSTLCYRRQCFATAHAVARVLNWPAEKFAVGFQSRLGSSWIEPFTDQLYSQLTQKNVRRLAVVCPSFTADCLETLEEVAIRGRALFQQAGGEELFLVPCVNDSNEWVAAAADLYRMTDRPN